MSSISHEKSKCKGIWLHRFKIVAQAGDAIIEICEICGKKKAFKMIDGRTNNLEYIKYHNRQCLPKQHNLYSHEYGK